VEGTDREVIYMSLVIAWRDSEKSRLTSTGYYVSHFSFERSAPPTPEKIVSRESYTREAFTQYHNANYYKTFSVTIQDVETLADRTSRNRLVAFFWV
jgi:hypothetical protein